MKLTSLFRVHVAKSRGFETYRRGDCAFVTNGLTNNGIQGFVKPTARDKIFDFTGICVSAFCEATVQKPPFIGRGNGGSGILVLEPLADMSESTLLFYAAYFNKNIRWKFSYGRMVSKERLSQMILPELPKIEQKIYLKDVLPAHDKTHETTRTIAYSLFKLSELFELKSGDYHDGSSIPAGTTPLVSCGEKDNGITRFVRVPQSKVYENALTVAYNGQPLTTKYHPYKFATKDDVAVCFPKANLDSSTLIFIQHILNSERWRFSYGRKCFHEKLMNLKIPLPSKENGKLDEALIKQLVQNTSYWSFLSRTIEKGISLREDIVSLA